MAVYQVTVQPTEPAVPLAMAKDAIGYESDDRDAEIEAIVGRATRHVEELAGVRLMAATIREYRDRFPSGCRGLIELAVGPVASVTSITYVDEAGVTQPLDTADYQTDLVSVPARIGPAYGDYWPLARRQLNTIAITYVAGQASRANVPASATQLILMFSRMWFDGCSEDMSLDDAIHSLLLDLKGWANA